MSRALVIVGVCATLAIGLGALIGGPSLGGVPILVWTAVCVLTVQWFAFAPAYLAQTERYYDLTGSLTYLATMAVCIAAGPRTLGSWVVAAMVCAWAGRLGTFLFLRIQRDGHDRRFTVMKTVWPRFLVAWTLQGLWVFLTSLAAQILILNGPELSPMFVVGVAIWGFGWVFEIVADRQKSRFRADPANAGRFITTGLWSWSQHPNYFGEIVLWFGVFVAGTATFTGTQWLAVLSPVFVALLLTRVSGIPLLDVSARERWGDDPEWQAYRARTSVLIPRPPQ